MNSKEIRRHEITLCVIKMAAGTHLLGHRGRVKVALSTVNAC